MSHQTNDARLNTHASLHADPSFPPRFEVGPDLEQQICVLVLHVDCTELPTTHAVPTWCTMLPSMSNMVRMAPTFDKSSPSRRLEAEGGAIVAVEVAEASGVAAGRICRQAACRETP